jgi:membrane protein
VRFENVSTCTSSPLALVKCTFNAWLEDGALRLSAALSYYSIFSIAPLLVIVMGLVGWFYGADAVRGELYGQLRGLVGPQSAETIQSMVISASRPAESKLATFSGLGLLILGASGVFGQLKDALNTIWKVKARSGVGIWPMMREYLLSFGMVLVIGFLLIVSLMLTSVLSAFSHWIESRLALPSWLWGGAALLISFAIVTLLFAVIFKVLPDVHIAWRHVWIGAVATALLFEVGKFLLGLYLGRESTASSYGAAGSVVLVLLWVYYASCILLFGAEFTRIYAGATGDSPAPEPIAEPVTSEDRVRQGLAPLHSTTPQPARESLPQIFVLSPPMTRPASRFDSHPTVRSSILSFALVVGCGFVVGLLNRRHSA